VREATGEYLLFLDDDVVLHEDYLARTVGALRENPLCAYAYCHYRRRGIYDDVIRAGPFSPRRLRRDNFISTMSPIRREAFVPWDERLDRFQDWDMWLTMLERGGVGVLVDDVLFTAWYHDQGITDPDPKRTRRAANKVRIKHGLFISIWWGSLKSVASASWRRLKRTHSLPSGH
jgi:hypothetical protein